MIVFGDSYTSGENNGNVSFADYLGIEKYGISGICLDDYSIYPVKGGLISQIDSCKGVENYFSKVLIEYGVNDAASLVTGYVSIETVKVAIAKVCDLLKNADVYFLMLSCDFGDLMKFSIKYAKYLNSEYMKDLCDVTAEDFLWCYSRVCELLQRKFKTLYMLPKGFNEFDVDGIHPTDKGYRIIAEKLKQQLS